MLKKIFPIEIEKVTEGGGRITISTPTLDRDKDRVLPFGAQVQAYQNNPVVQWGHNYRDPWATVGRTTNLEITDRGIVADFELRPAANESDPQNIVRLLWHGGWVKTASVGFNPIAHEENEEGGRDFTEWELLEWSLVPIPANQNALRLAAKALDIGDGQDVDQPGKAEQPTSEQPAKAETDADDSDDSDSGGQSKDEGRDESDQDESGDMDTEQPDLEGTDTNADEGALTPDQEAALAGALTDYLSAIQEVLGNE